MLEMNGEKVKQSLNKEKMLLVIRLWMIYQEMFDDGMLREMALVDFMFSILDTNPNEQSRIVVENRLDFDCFIKHYVLR